MMDDPTGYRAAATAAIFDNQGRLLFTRRAPHLVWGDMWCLPGGHLEAGERWDQAAVREVREEVGLEVEVTRLVGIYSDPALKFVYPAGRHATGPVQMLIAMFECRVLQGEPGQSDEVAQVRWCAMDDIPEPLMESHRLRVRHAFERAPQAYWM